MLKITGIALTCILSSLLNPAVIYPLTAYPETTLAGEYSSDIIDYDDIEREYYRERGSVYFSRESSFSFAHVYLRETGEKRYTWNLDLQDISENLKVLAGNFQAAFGSGLVVGKKNYLSPDPFSSSLTVTPENKFIPENSGNPLFSFNGIAASVPVETEFMDLSINGFYSIRNRYMVDEDMESAYTGSSLATLNSKIDPAYNRTEPAAIIDYALLGTVSILKNFSAEAYYINTQLKSPDNMNILWDYFNYGDEQRGIEEYAGYGIFLQYRDDYITLFTDFAETGTVSRSPDTGTKKTAGYGFLTGIRFRHPLFTFTATGKTSSEQFYGMYSSVSPYPERSWLTTASYSPLKSLSIGASSSSDIRLNPGKYQPYIPVTRREKASVKYRMGKSAGISISAGRVIYTGDDEDIVKQKYKLASDYRPSGFIRLAIDGKYQRSENSQPSGSAGTSLELSYSEYFMFSIKYSRYFISRDNSLYDKLFHDENSISTGSFIDQSLQTVEGKLRLKYNRNILSASYQATLLGREIIRKKFRIMGKMVF